MKYLQILFLMYMSSILWSQAGSLDTFFGNNGKITTKIGSSDAINSVAIQNDGKIVAVGYCTNISDKDFAVVRFNIDGSIDNSFSVDGKVSTIIGNSADYGYSVAIQEDGKIIIAGDGYNINNRDFVLIRLNNNGSLDNSFGDGGIVKTDFSGDNDYCRDVAIQEDGSIVMVGYTYKGSNFDVAIVRFNTNGTLDFSFSSDGKVMMSFLSYGSNHDEAHSVKIQQDNKIVVAGTTKGSKSSFGVLRLLPNGSLDTFFGNDSGRIITSFNNYDSFGRSLVLQSDDKIIVTGYTYNGSNYDFAICRYENDGFIDYSFGSNGKVTSSFGSNNDRAYSIKLLNNNKIVIAGESYDGSKIKFAVMRYNSNGSLDNTFGITGKINTEIGKFNDKANCLAIQEDGKILLAGYTSNGDETDCAIIRYNLNGSIDKEFGMEGISIMNIAYSNFLAQSMVVQSDEKILVAGKSVIGVNYNMAIARFNYDGTLDNSFGSRGMLTIAIGSSRSYLEALAIQNDGKIIIAGYALNGISQFMEFAIARLNVDGSLDKSFGNNGKVTTIVSGAGDYGESILIQNDGKIVLAGHSLNKFNNQYEFSCVRFNSDGSLDYNFGSAGILTTDIGTSSDLAYCSALQKDGKIVVGGYSYNGTYSDFSIVRYKANGGLDSSFGSGGKVMTSIGAYNDKAATITIQNDGKIVLGGSSFNGNNYDFALARYNINGTLDNLFSQDGKVITNIDNRDDFCSSITLQADNRIIAVGSSSLSNKSLFTIVRYNEDGSLDNSFDLDGKLSTFFGNFDDHAESVAVINDHKFVVSGDTYNGSFYESALARYNNILLDINKLDNLSSSVTYHPNPFKTKIILMSSESINNFNLTIYDLFGRKLKEIYNIYGDVFQINRDELINGIYLFVLSNETNIIDIQKIVLID